MSNTPRTDEAVVALGEVRGAPVQYVTAEFARKLERDLEICRDAHMANCLAADTLRDEIAELRERFNGNAPAPEGRATNSTQHNQGVTK